MAPGSGRRTVTVCIPAYRAGAFLPETLRSALAQTHADLEVLVGIDPPDEGPDDTRAAIRPLLTDPRLRVIENPVRLGWAENIDALLKRVETPFFAVLPHDDVWAPSYVATFLAALEAVPEAVVAYGDLLRFGAGPATRKSVALPGDDRRRHLMQFLVRGAEAMPWRGVTRTRVLAETGGFPTDRHKGFAAECEYALALIAAGRAVHLPRVLYFKRMHPKAVMSAARERIATVAIEERRLAWRAYDGRMRALLGRALAGCDVEGAAEPLYRAALDGALLARLQAAVAPALPPDEAGRAFAGLDAARLHGPDGGPAAAVLHLVLHRHWRAVGDAGRAANHARLALRMDPGSAGANLAVAEGMMAEGRLLEALELAMAARRLDEDGGEAAGRVVRGVYGRLGWG